MVNRLLLPYLAEAIRMSERGKYRQLWFLMCLSSTGDASPRDIDKAMKLGAGMYCPSHGTFPCRIIVALTSLPISIRRLF